MIKPRVIRHHGGITGNPAAHVERRDYASVSLRYRMTGAAGE